MNKTSRIVAIEGNTGCGKSQVLQWLSTFPSVLICEEPIEDWRNFSGQNLLDLRYSDPKRWSFAFQSVVQLSRIKMYSGRVHNPRATRFIERSLHSNRYCFLEMAKEMKHLEEIEFAILAKWFQYLECEPCTRLDLIVYLRTSPDVAFNRIKTRNRVEETGVNFDQIRNIHNKYETWITSGASGFKCVVIDANNDVNTVQQLIMSHLMQHNILSE
ncbi:deoxynucleoside kinase-like [Daphnia carinata]|uniref:deoxynucleoside kinase-like n=1 Tax=Daphnia carinata TaxID=120202 RepID=UPI00257D0AEE|nr:deoxynucleoside kinase-like [Daphnia carinata]